MHSRRKREPPSGATPRTREDDGKPEASRGRLALAVGPQSRAKPGNRSALVRQAEQGPLHPINGGGLVLLCPSRKPRPHTTRRRRCLPRACGCPAFPGACTPPCRIFCHDVLDSGGKQLSGRLGARVRSGQCAVKPQFPVDANVRSVQPDIFLAKPERLLGAGKHRGYSAKESCHPFRCARCRAHGDGGGERELQNDERPIRPFGDGCVLPVPVFAVLGVVDRVLIRFLLRCSSLGNDCACSGGG